MGHVPDGLASQCQVLILFGYLQSYFTCQRKVFHSIHYHLSLNYHVKSLVCLFCVFPILTWEGFLSMLRWTNMVFNHHYKQVVAHKFGLFLLCFPYFDMGGIFLHVEVDKRGI